MAQSVNDEVQKENEGYSDLTKESLVGLMEVMDGIITGLAEINSILKSEV